MGQTCLSIESVKVRVRNTWFQQYKQIVLVVNSKIHTMFIYFITAVLFCTIQNTANCSSQRNALGITRIPIQLSTEDFREVTLSPHLLVNDSTHQYWPILGPVRFRRTTGSSGSPPFRLKRKPYDDNIESETIALIAAVLLIGFQTVVLNTYGQPLTCKCGSIKLWHGNITDDQNSQHLTDWYTPNHVINGFTLYGALALLVPDTPISERFLISVGAAVGWEVFENSPFIINRFRQTALAHGYRGDSIINSISDTLATMIGFFLAHYLPVWASVFLVISEELILAAVVRDNLLINTIQLVQPIPAISAWQLDNSYS